MAIRRLGLGLLALAPMGCTSPNPAFGLGDGSGGGSGGSGGDGVTSQVSGDDATSVVSGSAGATSAGPASAGSTTIGDTAVDDPSADGTTIEPPPASTGEPVMLRALLVTQTGDASFPVDATMKAALEGMGAEVVLADDDTTVAGDADDVDVVVISETAFGAAVGAKFRDVARPVVAVESLVWDDMAMAPGGGWTPGVSFVIADAAHPIAAGLSGEVQVLGVDPGAGMSPTTPPPSAQIIARTPGPGPVTVFAYGPGDPMMGGVLAPAARVGFGADVDGNAATNSTADLTPQGVQMFVAAIEWCVQ